MKDRVLDLLIVLALAAAILIALTGGGTWDLGWIEISARRPGRALLIAAGLIVVHVGLVWRATRTLAVGRLIRAGFGSLLLATAVAYFVFLVRACGGLDSYGYVSAAEALLHGRLLEPLPPLTGVLAKAPEAAAPLGWILSPDRAHIVPEFPLGFPLVLAVFGAIGGPTAMFYATAVLAVGTVALTFWLSRRLGSRRAMAALSAVLVAANPVLFNEAIQPMSDVPATFWIVLAAAGCAAARASTTVHPRGRVASGGAGSVDSENRPRFALLGGVAAAMAIMTRPPLLLPAAVLIGLLWRAAGRRHGIAFGAVVLSGVGILMMLQWRLYGSPFVSGHGAAMSLFNWAAVPANLANQAKWFVRVHTPLLVPAVALALVWGGQRRLAAAALALFGAVALPYFFYTVRFDDWEMLRFLLPGLPFVLMAAAEGTVSAFRKVASPSLIGSLALAAAVLYGAWSYTFISRQASFELQYAEARYPLAGRLVARITPADSVIVARQQSGSLRYYSRRWTLNWDRLPPDALDEVIADFPQRELYALFHDSVEEAEFHRRFSRALGRVLVDPVGRVRDLTLVRLALKSSR